jgi:hypothetical protein
MISAQRQTIPNPAFVQAPVNSGILRHKCACGNYTSAGGECDVCKKNELGFQRRSADRCKPEVPPIVRDVLRSPGQPLDPATRDFFEPCFGYDFSKVKVHADSKAAASAEAVNALAYTAGSHIVFNREGYAPRTNVGLRLLAHELAHTVQQSDNSVRTSLRPPDGIAEESAEAAANNVMRSRLAPFLGKTAVGLACKPFPQSPTNISQKQQQSPDTLLIFNFDYLRGKQVTEDALAGWLVYKLRGGVKRDRLKQSLLSTHEFTGSQEARKHWATFMYEHWDDLLELQLLKEKGAEIEAEKWTQHERLEKEKRGQREQLAKFKSHTYEAGIRLGEVGYFQAEYIPSQGTLTISVPIQFTFEDTESEKTRLVGDPTGNKPVTVVTEKEYKRWNSSEIENWLKKFIKVVQDPWSSEHTQHTIYCHKPGWEILKAKVIVKVNKIGETTPGASYFQAKVYRGDSPAGLCGPGSAAMTECVRKGYATFQYTNVEGDAPVAAHEFGHMLGLGDEYKDTVKPQATEASHSRLVYEEFGYGIPRLDETRADRFRESIMSGGGKVLPEHGVVFLEAMRRITGIEEWHLRPKGS